MSRHLSLLLVGFLSFFPTLLFAPVAPEVPGGSFPYLVAAIAGIAIYYLAIRRPKKN